MKLSDLATGSDWIVWESSVLATHSFLSENEIRIHCCI